MKGKYTMIISIGFAALILTAIMFTQFKTVEQTDITAIETMRETELRTELADWKTKYDELEEKLNETESKINEYQAEVSNSKESSNVLDKELAETNMYLGYTKLQGEGIEITLSDNEYKTIDRWDLLQLVNELKLAGAEAISINNERIVSTTEIATVGVQFILINGNRIPAPFTVKAIGDKKYLESAITIKGGYIDEMKVNEKTVDYTVKDLIEIPAYSGKINFEYAEENK
ncbi:MAG: DUF881 domain-containing protein [Clostridia bacterium]|nr:DUF881 domain-containing protein [Clostridia bacterium]